MFIELSILDLLLLFPPAQSAGGEVMLDGLLCSRFSETARSHPRHREARWDGFDGAAQAVLGGRFADDLTERAAEGAEADESDVETDIGDVAVGLSKQVHRPLHAAALQVAVGGLAEGVLE